MAWMEQLTGILVVKDELRFAGLISPTMLEPNVARRGEARRAFHRLNPTIF
jgi:hypothetical protein